MSPLLPLAEGLGLALAVLLLGDWLYLLFLRPGNSLPRWFAGWRQDLASLPLLVLALALMLMVIALLGFGVAKAVRQLLWPGGSLPLLRGLVDGLVLAVALGLRALSQPTTTHTEVTDE